MKLFLACQRAHVMKSAGAYEPSHKWSAARPKCLLPVAPSKPEIRDGTSESRQQRRGERVAVQQRADESKLTLFSSVDSDLVEAPVDDPVLSDAVARINLELQLAVAKLVRGAFGEHFDRQVGSGAQ